MAERSSDLADEILEIVKTRRSELMQVAGFGSPHIAAFRDVLAVIEGFAKSDMRVP